MSSGWSRGGSVRLNLEILSRIYFLCHMSITGQALAAFGLSDSIMGVYCQPQNEACKDFVLSGGGFCIALWLANLTLV